MIPQKTVEELIAKHSLLEKDLSSGNIDKKLFAEKSKEYSDLNEIINDAKKYLSYEKDKNELEKILGDQNSDKELLKMAENEIEELQAQFKINEKKLKLFLLPKDEADKKNAIIEIRAGTGGLEASLFASDLLTTIEVIGSLIAAVLFAQEETALKKEKITVIRNNFIFICTLTALFLLY